MPSPEDVHQEVVLFTRAQAYLEFLAELRQQNPESYEILQMRWFEGRDVQDIAALKCVSPEVIWQRHHRAQGRFRTLWLRHSGNPFEASQ